MKEIKLTKKKLLSLIYEVITPINEKSLLQRARDHQQGGQEIDDEDDQAPKPDEKGPEGPVPGLEALPNPYGPQRNPSLPGIGDQDLDGFLDSEEIAAGSDPRDERSTPATVSSKDRPPPPGALGPRRVQGTTRQGRKSKPKGLFLKAFLKYKKDFEREHGKGKKGFRAFYKKLKAEDLLDKLGPRKEDYRFGPKHLEAFKALNKALKDQKGKENKKGEDSKKGKKGEDSKKGKKGEDSKKNQEQKDSKQDSWESLAADGPIGAESSRKKVTPDIKIDLGNRWFAQRGSERIEGETKKLNAGVFEYIKGTFLPSLMPKGGTELLMNIINKHNRAKGYSLPADKVLKKYREIMRENGKFGSNYKAAIEELGGSDLFGYKTLKQYITFLTSAEETNRNPIEKM